MNRKRPFAARIVFLMASAIALAGAVLWGRYAFRIETVDNPSLGIMSYHHQWGRRSWLLADTNRDGRVDVRTKLDRETGSFPQETWEDRDKNGVFEVHVIIDGDAISVIEYDEDQDGHYETRRTGAEALNLWNKITSEKNPE